ncbi:hypothetical protein [Rhizobium tumorigenes]|uniref:hypothetical protein n=1 Tax=Rhizobium tumorigenes TaxID=2041385 RepID=UPI00241FE3AC|nr:hypothetical protein [Rhizobium tumorigenes]WFS01574.1 hypothetical protein PR016_02770 [Rhizobium tumorigenes]
MAIETLRFALTSTAWTQISSGQANLTVDVRSGYGVKIAFAATAPDVALADYKSIDGGKSLALGSLGAVPCWAIAIERAAGIEVIRG